MSTNTSSRTSPLAAATKGVENVPSLLRKAAVAAACVFLAMAVSPVLVITSNLTSDTNLYDPLLHNDPLTWMHRNVEGIVFALQGMVIAASITVMVVCVRRVLASSVISDIMVTVGILPVVSWMIFGAATAQTYSASMAGDIASVQPDASIRSMVGYAQISITQGILGSAGVSLAAWAVLLFFASRTTRVLRKIYLTLVLILSLGAIVATVLGLGGLAALLSGLPLMLVVTVSLLSAARRAKAALAV